MYQANPAFKIPNTFILDRNRERKVVFYGRVSTEHEEQLAALENQMTDKPGRASDEYRDNRPLPPVADNPFRHTSCFQSWGVPFLWR